jgi:hypothetical protein
MRIQIAIALIAVALVAGACSGSGSPAGSASPSSAPTGTSASPGSPLEGTWTSSAQSGPDLVKVIAARGFAPAQVRPWVSSHLDPAPSTFSLRFVGGRFSQFQGTSELSSGAYTVSGDSLTWTESDAGCAVTVPFHVSGSTLSFGKIGHEGCPSADAHMAHALFFGETYGKAG